MSRRQISIILSTVNHETTSDRVNAGTTLREYLVEDCNLILSKHDIRLNGELVSGSDLDAELEDGDTVSYSNRNHSSGLA